MDSRQEWYMVPLSDRAPSNDRESYVFYKLESTQNTPYIGVSFEHVHNLMFLQQSCAKCEDNAKDSRTLYGICCPKCSRAGSGPKGPW
jgi:hypothetical protein